ncbi:MULTISPECIES: BrxE family protein [Pseudomonas]|uniref:BrxE family protein n=1 Tax=Pseudomonas TaxID=286 RepID=UPI001F45766B|nr:BrxE family protein [Pseudomonas fulva]
MIKDAQTIAELRVLVGYLGEQQPAWWPSQFFSPTAAAFLGPVFTRSTTLAQYQGVTAAAARKHEEHIGEGSTFHLFRLPEIFEESAAGGFSDKVFESRVRTLVSNRDQALARLAELAGGTASASEGPVVVGDFGDELSDPLKSCAALYLDAFNKGIQCFPFLREAQ